MASTTDIQSIDRIRDISTLTLAALFPEEFSLDWILAVSGERATVAIDAMEEGVDLGILLRQRPGVYAFRDSEKQAECLSSLTDEEINTLHRQTAHLVKERLPDTEEMLPVLAHQLIRTTNDIDDCQSLYEAGKVHHKSYAPSKALLCYEKVIQTLQSIKGAQADKLFAESVIMYARIFSHQKDSAWIQDRIAEAIERSQDGAMRHLEALLSMHLAKFLFFDGQPELALERFEEGWHMVETSGNPDIMYRALTFRIFFFTWQGRFGDVVKMYEEHAHSVERLPRSRFPVSAISHLGYSLVLGGRVSEGIGMLCNLHDHCRSIGDSANLNLVILSLAQTCLASGHVKEGIGVLKGIKTLAEERLESYYGSLSYYRLVAEAYALVARYDEAIHALSQGKALLGPGKIFLIRSDGCNRMAAGMSDDEICRLTGHTPEEIIQNSLEHTCIYQHGMAYLFRARRWENENRPAGEILEVLKLSIERLQESGHKIQLAKARFDLARVHLSLGSQDKAGKAFLEARQLLAPINSSLIPEDLVPHFQGVPEEIDFPKKMSNLGLEIMALRNHRDLVSHLLSSINRLAGTERGAIFLVSDHSEPPQIELHAARNLSKDQIGHPDFGPSMAVITKTIDDGTPRMVAADADGNGQGLPVDDPGSFRSCFCLPLILKGKTLGALYHDNRFLNNALEKTDLEALSLLADQAAIALQNAWAYEKLVSTNRSLLSQHQYYVAEDIQRSRFDDFIGESPPMQRVFDQISRVAGEDTVVLIQGETGVGKELVARTIHRQSPRVKSFVSADCSALTETIITSELFGHEKGAFTGALARKAGRFELAHGGTLFLDEIGNISRDVQVRLLRVLQTKEFQRVGGIETVHSDFRLITATNRDLGREIEAGRFREDLYYRLNVFPIVVPPLRERREDIPALALFFLRKDSARMGKPFDSIPKGEIDGLVRYPWPGNVRELQNVIERGIILSSGARFRVPELGRGRGYTLDTTLTTLAENERRYILRVLEETEGRIKGENGAAQILGLPNSTLFSRMKKLGIKIDRRAATG